MFRYVLVLTIIACLNDACAYNILVIFTLPLRSHYMAVKPLFDELALRGHNVTVINNFPDEKSVENPIYVDLKNNKSAANTMPPLTLYESTDPRFLQLYNIYRHVGSSTKFQEEHCDSILNNADLKALVESGVKYDVIFVEQFMSDCGLVYAAAHYDAPIIGITSHVLLPWAYSRLGLPFDHVSDAFYFVDSGTNPSFLYKMQTRILDSLFNTIGKWYIHFGIYNSFNRHLPDYVFDVEDLARDRMRMVFSYQHYSLTGGRLLAPQLLEIGGIHIGQSKPLPKEIDDFINNSEHGVIYVSFGSNLKASTMSVEKLSTFLAAFEEIPQNVVFKFENDSMPTKSKKILTKKWFPQLDVLCHPKVVAFISHGGMLGTSEAAYCGVPMLAIPFFGDQFGNAAIIREAGLGTSMYFYDINKHNLLEKLKEVTTEKVRRRAKEISTVWRDRNPAVMDSAIYWTEHVARYQNSPPPLPAKYQTIYEKYLLDVVFIAIVIFFFYILLTLLKCCLSKIIYLIRHNKKNKIE